MLMLWDFSCPSRASSPPLTLPLWCASIPRRRPGRPGLQPLPRPSPGQKNFRPGKQNPRMKGGPHLVNMLCTEIFQFFSPGEPQTPPLMGMALSPVAQRLP
jgi:hypothetical protein